MVILHGVFGIQFDGSKPLRGEQERSQVFPFSACAKDFVPQGGVNGQSDRGNWNTSWQGQKTGESAGNAKQQKCEKLEMSCGRKKLIMHQRINPCCRYVSLFDVASGKGKTSWTV